MLSLGKYILHRISGIFWTIPPYMLAIGRGIKCISCVLQCPEPVRLTLSQGVVGCSGGIRPLPLLLFSPCPFICLRSLYTTYHRKAN